MERRRFLRQASAATVGATLIAGCGAPDDEGTPADADDGDDGTPTDEETPTGEETQTTTTGTDGDGNEVLMVTEGQDYYFDPVGLFVEPGTTVTWTNETGTHSSTAYSEELDSAETTRIPEEAEPWDSGTLTDEGATFEHTFDVSGTYDYFCIPHKSLEMVGRIVVGEPGGPAEGSQPPDGDVPESSAIVDQGAIAWDDFSG